MEHWARVFLNSALYAQASLFGISFIYKKRCALCKLIWNMSTSAISLVITIPLLLLVKSRHISISSLGEESWRNPVSQIWFCSPALYFSMIPHKWLACLVNLTACMGVADSLKWLKREFPVNAMNYLYNISHYLYGFLPTSILFCTWRCLDIILCVCYILWHTVCN